jgi:hypothetical protein
MTLKAIQKLLLMVFTYTSDTIKTLYNKDGNICADGKVIIHTDSKSSFIVNIAGSTGNVSTISGNMNVKGPVHGNVTSTSGDLSITGNISQNVTTTSGEINIYGRVGGKVSSISDDISIK